MTINILRVAGNSFDFTCDGESFRLNHDRDLQINEGKITDSIKGIVFQRNDLAEEELALKIFEENKQSSDPIVEGGNPKRFYGVKWIFEDQSFLPEEERIVTEEPKTEEGE